MTQAPTRYRHYKGQEYELIGFAKHSESLEKLVVYRALYGEGELWVRPFDMFFGKLVVDGVERERFSKMDV